MTTAPEPEPALVVLGRAAGGALIFGLPLLLTMEMWTLSSASHPGRLALLLVLLLPLLTTLSHFVGFEPTVTVRQNVIDAGIALAVAFPIAVGGLTLFGVIDRGTSLPDAAAKIAVQVVAASFGAMLASSLLRESDEDETAGRRPRTFWGEAFLAGVGAVFLSLNVAPTDEMVLIAFAISPLRAAGIVLLSLAVMHAFVFALEFRGQSHVENDERPWSVFLRFTVMGYAVALCVAAFVLWTFGRFDGLPAAEALRIAVVVALPASVGAASARLLL